MWKRGLLDKTHGTVQIKTETAQHWNELFEDVVKICTTLRAKLSSLIFGPPLPWIIVRHKTSTPRFDVGRLGTADGFPDLPEEENTLLERKMILAGVRELNGIAKVGKMQRDKILRAFSVSEDPMVPPEPPMGGEFKRKRCDTMSADISLAPPFKKSRRHDVIAPRDGEWVFAQ